MHEVWEVYVVLWLANAKGDEGLWQLKLKAGYTQSKINSKKLQHMRVD
jgi:hypothetical protein